MKALLLAVLLVLTPALAHAKVVNIELKFTPYTGQPAKEDHVESVPGTAAIFVNDVPYAEQKIEKESVPVQFAERDIAPAVWIPVASLGPVIRKGKNTIRVEFTPTDAEASYHAQFAWVSVTDEETNRESDGTKRPTNAQDLGKEEGSGKGKMVVDREITVDFMPDLPWHHYPAVTTLSDDDKQKLTAMVLGRVGTFKPNFKAFYQILASDERVDVAKVKQAKCVDAAYAAGVRIDSPTADQLAFFITGKPEVIISRNGGNLFMPANPSALGKVKGDETQMCAGIALSLVFPPKLVVVRSPDGTWQTAY